MSKKHFSWLLLVTTAVAVLVLLFPGKAGRESSVEPSVLIPGMAEQVNDIEWMRLTAAGDETIATLNRESGFWVVEEASSYRADWDLVKTLLSALSQAEVIEVKTANPEYYSRLGVEEVDSAEAGGVMVEFAGDSGLPALIIGNEAQGRGGQYARLRSSVESVLIDAEIDIPREQSDWLESGILDISDAEVVEFEIIHTDGESVKALKASADEENFKLQEVPDGREIKSQWSVDAPANSLAALDLQDVVPESQFNWEDATRFRILTADGLVVETDLLAVDDGQVEDPQSRYWIRLAAGIYTTGVGTAAGADDVATTARADEINSRISGWAYEIPAYRYETMVRRMDELLSTAESE